MIGGLALAGKGIISTILTTVIFIVTLIIIISNINRTTTTILCGSVGGTGDQLPLFQFFLADGMVPASRPIQATG